MLGSLQHILAVLGRLRESHPAVAETIADLALNYEHDALLAIIRQAGGEHDPATD